MPQVTVYVREEDLPGWKAVEKKSEFIHNALAGNAELFKQPAVSEKQGRPTPQKKNSRLCEHGQPKDKCLFKGCKNARS